MHIVSRAPFDTATRQFPNQAAALDDVYRTLKRELHFTGRNEKTICLAGQNEISGEVVGDRCWRWEFKGDVFADFERGKIFIKHITTHAEYDKLTDFYRRTKE